MNKEELVKAKKRERMRKYYLSKKDYFRAKHKAWNRANKEKIKEWQKLNREKINHSVRELKKKNPQVKIRENLRKRTRNVIKGQKSKKMTDTLALLGCSLDFLKIYLESKFQEGMSWENYGYYGWHIDHVRPCCCFDLTKEADQRECFHYTNLQPLWAKDNLSKARSRII